MHAPKLPEVNAELTKILQTLHCYLSQGLRVLPDACTKMMEKDPRSSIDQYGSMIELAKYEPVSAEK